MAGGGGKYDLNLTPYIDLMSTLVVFLLMTAVWNQISVLSTDTADTSGSEAVAKLNKQTQLSVTIMPNYLELAENQKVTRIPHQKGAIDRQKLTALLKIWKYSYPKKTDVVLNSENSVSYKMLINTFDELVGQQFPDVGVNTQ